MTSDQEKAKRWLPKFRLWHLFALILVTAVGLWVSRHVGVELRYRPSEDSWNYVTIEWDGRTLIDHSWGNVMFIEEYEAAFEAEYEAVMEDAFEETTEGEYEATMEQER